MSEQPMPEQPLVGVIMGSYSDLGKVEEVFEALKEFGVPFEARALSAHRSPAEVCAWAAGARERGLKAIVAAAGGSAALAGVVAAHTVLPVIGLPVPSGFMDGLDSLLSTVQMPAGIPVATVAVGGARNAGLLAVAILATGDPALAEALAASRAQMTAKVLERDTALQSRLRPH